VRFARVVGGGVGWSENGASDDGLDALVGAVASAQWRVCVWARWRVRAFGCSVSAH
jgi:hypothetical protein